MERYLAQSTHLELWPDIKVRVGATPDKCYLCPSVHAIYQYKHYVLCRFCAGRLQRWLNLGLPPTY